MKRAIKASIAALAFVPALGFAMAAPADADPNVNLNPGHCQVKTTTSGVCYFIATQNPSQELYIRALTGSGTASVRCNERIADLTLPPHGGPVSATNGTNSATPFFVPTGTCQLTVAVTGGTGFAEGWTWP